MQIEDIVSSIVNKQPLIEALSGSSDQVLFEFMEKSGFSSRHELMIVLEELLINAREHGQKKSVRVYAQKLMGFLYFVIADQGPGIHVTLPKNPHLSDTLGKSPTTLIRLAMEEGITGTAVIGRGLGLYLLSEYILKNQGEAVLLSDGGVVIQVHNITLQKKSAQPWDGTLIALKISLGESAT